MNRSRGFTLIEVLVVIGILAVLAAVVLVAVNPARQFKLARDSQRVSNVNAILNTVGQNIAENHGIFMCNSTRLDIPTSPTIMKNSGGFDIAPCVVPIYISSLPFDPSVSGAHYNATNDYDTGYSISIDTQGRVKVSATGEIDSVISVVR
ncbi:type II secretion system protein [bacterium]|nr:type II secretion system protein [bacterium]